MNTRTLLLAASAIAALCSTPAFAEQYQGVLVPSSQFSRAEVHAQAIAAAREGDIYAESASAGLHPSVVATTDRARVRGEARAIANAKNQNLDSKAFFNSVVPSQYRQNIVSSPEQAAL